MENTFVTPVFNGSASLRDASGQLIEKTVKSVRRGQEITDEYIEELYSDTASLYRLNQIGGGPRSAEKEDLGELPRTAVWLLSALLGAWGLIILYVIFRMIKRKAF